MATLIKGLLSFNLDWQFVLVGIFVAITMELCNVKSLSFAVGLYLPLSTTLPIWVGGALKGLTDWLSRRKGEEVEDAELGKGSLFATGLVAGGALMGLVVAIWQAKEASYDTGQGWLPALNLEENMKHALGDGGYQMLGVAFFATLAWLLVRAASRK